MISTGSHSSCSENDSILTDTSLPLTSSDSLDVSTSSYRRDSGIDRHIADDVISICSISGKFKTC